MSISPVLAAMKVDPRVAGGAVRLSVGRHTTEAEVDSAAEFLVERARQLQSTAGATPRSAAA